MEMMTVRPEETARIILLQRSEALIACLSNDQKFAVLATLVDTHLPDVITFINSKPGGTFRYIARENVRVIVGSGGIQTQKGWLTTDIDQLNIVEDASWQRLFQPSTIDRILAEHVLEHLTLRDLKTALENAHRFLKPGGWLRAAVPDAFHPSRYYYNLVKPGGWETPYEHMLLLDYEMLSRIGREIGFRVRLLEYFDENGLFHIADYDSEDGIVQRCARNNIGLNTSDNEVMNQFYSSIPDHLRQQFLDRRMTYTSLIVDLIKPE